MGLTWRVAGALLRWRKPEDKPEDSEFPARDLSSVGGGVCESPPGAQKLGIKCAPALGQLGAQFNTRA